MAVRLKLLFEGLKFAEYSCLVKESNRKILSAVREQALSKMINKLTQTNLNEVSQNINGVDSTN